MARIRVVLSYALLLAVLCFLLVFLQSYFIFLLLVLFFCFPFFSVLSGRFVFRRLTLTVSAGEPQSEKEAEGSFVIRVNKPLLLPLGSLILYFTLENVCYPSGREHSITVALPIGSSISLSLPFSSHRAGCVRLSVKRAEGADMLGLAVFRRPISIENEILILPSQIALALPEEGPNSTGQDDPAASPASGQTSSEITGFRDYRPGDRLQAIHWKLSVKNTRSVIPSSEKSLNLIVKEFEHPSATEPYLLLELCQHPREAPDAVFDLAYSLGLLLLEDQKPFYLCWYSQIEGEIKQERICAALDFLSALTRMFYSGLYEESDRAYLEYKNEGISGSLFYLCPADREKEIAGEPLCRCRGQAVLLTC